MKIDSYEPATMAVDSVVERTEVTVDSGNALEQVADNGDDGTGVDPAEDDLVTANDDVRFVDDSDDEESQDADGDDDRSSEHQADSNLWQYYFDKPELAIAHLPERTEQEKLVRDTELVLANLSASKSVRTCLAWAS
jgi:hypothetical protein